MKTSLLSVQSPRTRSARSGSLPHLCNWTSPMRCSEPVEVTFESGLGYCRAHARAVKANRKWLPGFFEALKFAKERKRDA